MARSNVLIYKLWITIILKETLFLVLVPSDHGEGIITREEGAAW